MSLDLPLVSVQAASLARFAREQEPQISDRLARAVSALKNSSGDFERLAELATSNSWRPFRAASPTEPLDRRIPAALGTNAYTVVATDGSQIEPDRHGPVMCNLINVGSALIRYGSRPAATLQSEPLLGFSDDDLYLRSGERELLLQDRLLSLKRQVLETRKLAEVAVRAQADSDGDPVVALADGTLLVSTWGQGDDSNLLDKYITDFLACLDTLQAAGIPVASYVSRPRSRDVTNVLRLAICPLGYECDSKCRGKPARSVPCGIFAELADRSVFDRLLEPGERSGVFISSWQTSHQRYGAHKVHFFYLNVGKEIARVEVPEWVAKNSAYLAQVHQVILNQVEHGQGYPRALIEAHEKAVLTAGDRRAYADLIQRALISVGVRASTSEKELSKRVRSV